MNKLFSMLFICLLFISCKSGDYPLKGITDIVVWGAGGGTDYCNRLIMDEMAKILEVNITVENITGGEAGSKGLAEAYLRKHDGYTFCGLSESCVPAGVLGGFDKGIRAWDYYIIGGSPGVLSVTQEAPYYNLKELIETVQMFPGSLKAGAGGTGSIHHLNLLALEKGAGVRFEYLSYNGSAPMLDAAVMGEVSVVVASLAEQADLIRRGKLRPLATLVPNAYKLDGTVIPSAFNYYPTLAEVLPIRQAIAFALAADTPDSIKATVETAFKKAMASDIVRDFAAVNHYLLSGQTGEEALGTFLELEVLFTKALREMGTLSE